MKHIAIEFNPIYKFSLTKKELELTFTACFIHYDPHVRAMAKTVQGWINQLLEAEEVEAIADVRQLDLLAKACERSCDYPLLNKFFHDALKAINYSSAMKFDASSMNV